MPKETLTQGIIRYLKYKGHMEIESRSRKYRTFTGIAGNKYFVGKRGALRVGRHISSSYSLEKYIPKIKIWLKNNPK